MISSVQGQRIVIDPGHGGPDAGAIGPAGTREKDVTLAISHRLRDYLEARGAEVRLTRATDRSVARPDAPPNEELQARCDVANALNADVFVSIHANASQSSRASGMEVYHARRAGTAARRLARVEHDRLAGSLPVPARGVKAADFYVLTETHMPSVLVEVAFLTNPDEERLLANPEMQEAAAHALGAGLEEYFISGRSCPVAPGAYRSLQTA
ncbi:MAG: N-acetylmuramoyl-L-alanine amidase [Armatimonadetes bacterium]|nr:N-acetylmuramoyl-L-alanine amidase [Armatimonadota bacterium]